MVGKGPGPLDPLGSRVGENRMTERIRQVAFLRGINVGRAKRVDMTTLRGLLGDLGYTEVTTYLQSGNVVFTCGADVAAAAAYAIEQALQRAFDFEVRVIVRSHAELAAALDTDPLLELARDPAKHLIGFFSGDPHPDGLRALGERDLAPDVMRVQGRHVYLWCPRGVNDSAFARLNWEKLLGVAVTMRNWNTAIRLRELSGG
jgi:uncharacterized protein (DUF1697 family)